jgi:two-component system, chemotaxis family, chemotaxis protein CheY
LTSGFEHEILAMPHVTDLMHILIVEDDPASRLLLVRMLDSIGRCDVAANGKEAVEAYRKSLETGVPYAFVCLDIMMPEMDGVAALKAIRAEEDVRALRPSQAAKIVMTTVLHDLDSVTNAYRELCDGYLVKPISRERLTGLLRELDLLTCENP